jgi:predicted  nucleic acid-binding Zn-ribbon protein
MHRVADIISTEARAKYLWERMTELQSEISDLHERVYQLQKSHLQLEGKFSDAASRDREIIKYLECRLDNPQHWRLMCRVP